MPERVTVRHRCGCYESLDCPIALPDWWHDLLSTALLRRGCSRHPGAAGGPRGGA